MHMTLLGAGARAGLAPDAVLGPRNGHDLVAHVVAVFVLALERLLDQFQHIEAADLKAATAADAFVELDRIDEFRCPGLPAPGGSGSVWGAYGVRLKD